MDPKSERDKTKQRQTDHTIFWPCFSWHTEW